MPSAANTEIACDTWKPLSSFISSMAGFGGLIGL